jgi:hypothetical protein
MINETNISFYLKKLSSGVLTDEEFELLMIYLEKTEYQKETYSEEELILDENFKESLRKPDTASPSNFYIDNKNSEELFLVAAIENQLTEREKIYLNNKCASDGRFEKKYQDYKKTILPIDSFFFPEKKNLKKTSPFNLLKPVFWSSVAASLLFFIWFTNKTENPIVAISSRTANKIYRNGNEKPKNPTVANNHTQFKKPIISFSTQISAKKDTNSTFIRQINGILAEDIPLKKDTIIVKNNQFDSITQNRVADNKIKDNDSAPVTKPFEISDKKKIESITIGQFINRKINKLVFKKEKPEIQDKYYALTTILKRTLNVDMQLKKASGDEEKLILASLTIGKFKYEHK